MSKGRPRRLVALKRCPVRTKLLRGSFHRSRNLKGAPRALPYRLHHRNAIRRAGEIAQPCPEASDQLYPRDGRRITGTIELMSAAGSAPHRRGGVLRRRKCYAISCADCRPWAAWPRNASRGEMAERLKAPHSKCGIGATLSGVRIPLSPPLIP